MRRGEEEEIERVAAEGGTVRAVGTGIREERTEIDGGEEHYDTEHGAHDDVIYG